MREFHTTEADAAASGARRLASPPRTAIGEYPHRTFHASSQTERSSRPLHRPARTIDTGRSLFPFREAELGMRRERKYSDYRARLCLGIAHDVYRSRARLRWDDRQRRVLDPAVRRAIADIRERGITVSIVTGRIYSTTFGVQPETSASVDAVVAENGAVAAFPNSGQSVILRLRIPAACRRAPQRGVPIQVGHCVIEADASFAHDFSPRFATSSFRMCSSSIAAG